MADAKDQPTLEDVKAEIVEKHGLDAEIQSDLITKLAEERMEISSTNQKELSKAIDKKAEYRQQLIDDGKIDPKTFKPIKKKEPDGKLNKPNKDDFDYGQLAYLSTKKLDSGIAQKAIKDYLAENSGKTLEQAVTNKFLLAEINEQLEVQKTKDATPSSTKRAPTSGKGSVDYWIDKGEMPPADQVQLRRDVLNARIARDKQGSQFANQSVVSKSA